MPENKQSNRGERNFVEHIKPPVFWSSFSNIDNLRTIVQIRRERQHQHLARQFFLKDRPIHFH